MLKKKLIMLGAITLMVMFSTQKVLADDITLTEDIVLRYIKTFPEMSRLTKAIEKASKIKDEVKQKEQFDPLFEQKATLLEINKWQDFSEYMDTGSRILPVNIQLNVRKIFADLKDERNPKAMAAIKKIQKELGYQPEEIIAVAKHNNKLNKMYKAAGLRKK